MKPSEIIDDMTQKMLAEVNPGREMLSIRVRNHTKLMAIEEFLDAIFEANPNLKPPKL